VLKIKLKLKFDYLIVKTVERNRMFV